MEASQVSAMHKYFGDAGIVEPQHPARRVRSASSIRLSLYISLPTLPSPRTTVCGLAAAGITLLFPSAPAGCKHKGRGSGIAAPRTGSVQQEHQDRCTEPSVFSFCCVQRCSMIKETQLWCNTAQTAARLSGTDAVGSLLLPKSPGLAQLGINQSVNGFKQQQPTLRRDAGAGQGAALSPCCYQPPLTLHPSARKADPEGCYPGSGGHSSPAIPSFRVSFIYSRPACSELFNTAT